MSVHHTDLTIDQLDVDGALRETAERVDLDTRSAFLRKAGVFGGSILAGGAALGGLPAAASAKSVKNDIAILNFALTLEYLEETFYDRALTYAGISGPERDLTKTVHKHEDTHVRTLKAALGKKAVKKPKFDFQNTVHHRQSFLRTAYKLENEGVAAYSGQAFNILEVKYAKVALSIVTVEARHAALFAYALGHLSGPMGPTPNGAFDKPKSKKRVQSDVAKTHFIKK